MTDGHWRARRRQRHPFRKASKDTNKNKDAKRGHCSKDCWSKKDHANKGGSKKRSA